jgi:flagellar hook-associated protein 3 FlgL
MRISTSLLHQQGLQGLLQRQQGLARTQQEMISGNKLITAADDPAAFATAQRIDHAVASLEQFERSSGLVEHRLRLQEQALDDVGDVLIRARELAIQANSGALADPDREAVAAEVRSLREALIDIGNREDGSGRRLFAGTRDAVAPFVDAGGAVGYAGDDGHNRVDIGPDVSVADTDPGSDVFMRVRTGDGEIRGMAGAANTGSGVLQSSAVTDYATWGGASLTVEFTAPDAYQVTDAAGTVVATGSYVPGDGIAAGGVQLQLTGDPAAGDTFTVQRAPTRDVFATLDRLADALEMPTASAADRARRDNVLGASIADLGTAQEHMLSIRAGTGTRLATLDTTADARSAEEVSLASTLSNLRDVDYAEAATQLSLHMTALEAAQRTMVRVQGLSLFDALR